MTENISFLARGGAWVAVQSLLMLAVIVLGVVHHGDWTRMWMTAGDAVLFLAGGGVGVAGVIALGGNRTAYPRPREDSELVQRGIYAHVRHPLYTSVILSSLGWALIWQSTTAFGAALVCVPFFWAKALHEERWLRAKFAGYSDYARRVPRFLPRIGRNTHL